MPQQQIVPTWTSWNNANFTNASGMSDPVSNQPYNSGGLNLGDYFDATNDEAANASYQTNGLLFAGRYRLVQVDSGATASNVKTGTVGYVRSGSTVKSAQITAVGSGGTPGTYPINATAGTGGGSGAQITVVVGANGTITSAFVSNPGVGYVSPPTFNVGATSATGATGATVVAQLGVGINVVTSADIALTPAGTNAGIGPVHPVVFLNSITPGNFGFVQELGVATVLAGSGNTQAQSQNALPSTSSNGTMIASSAAFSILNIGVVIDPLTTPLANTPFKILLTGPVVQD